MIQLVTFLVSIFIFKKVTKAALDFIKVKKDTPESKPYFVLISLIQLPAFILLSCYLLEQTYYSKLNVTRLTGQREIQQALRGKDQMFQILRTAAGRLMYDQFQNTDPKLVYLYSSQFYVQKQIMEQLMSLIFFFAITSLLNKSRLQLKFSVVVLGFIVTVELIRSAPSRLGRPEAIPFGIPVFQIKSLVRQLAIIVINLVSVYDEFYSYNDGEEQFLRMMRLFKRMQSEFGVKNDSFTNELKSRAITLEPGKDDEHIPLDIKKKRREYSRDYNRLQQFAKVLEQVKTKIRFKNQFTAQKLKAL